MSFYQLMDFYFDKDSVVLIKDPRLKLMNSCCSFILGEQKLWVDSSRTRDDLYEAMLEIADIEPEFILMAANYTRNKLGLRQATNFMLAFCTYYDSTKPFCKKYFNQCIRLPSDLIEVCEYAQLIPHYLNGNWASFKTGYLRIIPYELNLRKQISFSKTLQKLCASKFPQFNVYQLGKYCSDARRKSIIYKYVECRDAKVRTLRVLKRFKKNIKKQERYLNLKKKQQKLVNKKQRQRSVIKKQKTDKHFREVMVYTHNNRRFITMKDIIKFCHISQPKWNVMSILGCKYPKSNDLFNMMFPEDDALQFDPTKAGKRMKIPTPVTWDRELSQNAPDWEGLIIKNQIPYMALVKNLRNILKNNVSISGHEIVIQRLGNVNQIRESRMMPLQFYKSIQALREIEQKATQRMEKKNKQLILEFENQKISKQILQGYIVALEGAMNASIESLSGIAGITYLLVDCNLAMTFKYHDNTFDTRFGTALVLSQLIRAKCEVCEYYLYSTPKKNNDPYQKVNFNEDNIHEAIERCQKYTEFLGNNDSQLGWVIDELLVRGKAKADNVIVISNFTIMNGFKHKDRTFDWLLKEYMNKVNPNVKWFFLDVAGEGKELKHTSSNCFILNGLSEKLIEYIGSNQHNQIEDVYKFNQDQQQQMNQN